MSVSRTLLLRKPDGERTKQPPDESVTLDQSWTLWALWEPLCAHPYVENNDTFLLEPLQVGWAHTGTSPHRVQQYHSSPAPAVLLGPILAEGTEKMRGKQVGLIPGAHAR